MLATVLILSALTGAAAEEAAAALARSVPPGPGECTAERSEKLFAAAEQLERWADELQWRASPVDAAEVLRVVEQLVSTREQADRSTAQLLAFRGQFLDEPDEAIRRTQLHEYLRSLSRLLELSGRLRYRLRDVLDFASYDLDPQPEQFDRLLDLLEREQVALGPVVMSYVLLDPEPGSDAVPYPPATRARVLRLIELTQPPDVVPALAEFVRQESTGGELLLKAAELLRQLGLPQEPRPGQSPRLPAPAITAGELRQILQRRLPVRFRLAQRNRYRALDEWLAARERRGVQEDYLQLGPYQLRSGDWLLMRNPSPFNRFSDLTPGLFTHVGLVTEEIGEDGIRRFLIVDLPERSERIPAATADAYLRTLLHYFVLRHDDPEVGRVMGELGSKLIGRESQFDLQFDTARVLAAKGKVDQLPRIHTYCAGFLLLCAQETGRPREEFFPIREGPASERCLQNFARLGLSVGESFVSPTGALFAPAMQLVAWREPMYSPANEIQDSIFDHFAAQMIEGELTPDPDLYQRLREELAGLSRSLPWLASALARANGVSERMDLVAAAKAAAVIEVLNQVAEENVSRFEQARSAIMADPAAPPDAAAEELRRVHAALVEGWNKEQVSPRELRIELVRFYAQRGREALDRRLFRKP